MRRASFGFAALVTAMIVSSLGTTVSQAAPASRTQPHVGPIRIVPGGLLPLGQVTSKNWSGYATKGTKFKAVSGHWTQPAVNCSTAPNGIVVFWVGLDGYTSSTVEQDGTIAICSGGSASYFDWWEMYPTNAVQIVNPISVGDKFNSSVTYNGSGGYKLTVTDMTHSAASFTTNQSCASCQRTSAEWIAEAPCCQGGNVYPMPNWGKINFSKSSTTNDAGHTGTISDAAWSNDEITMVNGASQVKAKPGPLKKNGASFAVTWKQAS